MKNKLIILLIGVILLSFLNGLFAAIYHFSEVTKSIISLSIYFFGFIYLVKILNNEDFTDDKDSLNATYKFFYYLIWIMFILPGIITLLLIYYLFKIGYNENIFTGSLFMGFLSIFMLMVIILRYRREKLAAYASKKLKSEKGKKSIKKK